MVCYSANGNGNGIDRQLTVWKTALFHFIVRQVTYRRVSHASHHICSYLPWEQCCSIV
jgi:hypothetical protein